MLKPSNSSVGQLMLTYYMKRSAWTAEAAEHGMCSRALGCIAVPAAVQGLLGNKLEMWLESDPCKGSLDQP